MRLINIHTLEMEEFVADLPPYAILSHRWIGREITYEEYLKSEKRTGPGFQKILNFCKTLREDETLLALTNRILYDRHMHLPSCSDAFCDCLVVVQKVEWVWVDTCCIDKRSSAELSEAINSMWSWYRDSTLCVVYLNDVTARNDLCRSEWFTRGWTLQELLAPENTLLYNWQWDILGANLRWTSAPTLEPVNLSKDLSQASGIPQRYLEGHYAGNTHVASVAQRMSWASCRRTTRKEDEAYCLFGLFGINLPLLYGEGERAFLRLQQEIARCSKDQSLFAWQFPHPSMNDYAHPTTTGLLAHSPELFKDSGNILASNSIDTGSSFVVNGQYVEVHATMVKFPEHSLARDDHNVSTNPFCLLLLNCVDCSEPDSWNRCALVLRKARNDMHERRHQCDPLDAESIVFWKAIVKHNAYPEVVPGTVRVAEPGTSYQQISGRHLNHSFTGYKILHADCTGNPTSVNEVTQNDPHASVIWRPIGMLNPRSLAKLDQGPLKLTYEAPNNHHQRREGKY